MKQYAFAVHSWNEGEALRRLVRSTLPIASMVSEWVVVDHRSDDATPAIVQELRAELSGRGIRLQHKREERGLSKAFTFSDLRNLTIGMVTAPLYVLCDADFVACRGFDRVLQQMAGILLPEGSRYWGAGWNVPVIWDRVATDKHGRITDHGRIWVHSRRPRIIRRGAMECRQDGNNGRWDAFYPTCKRRKKKYHLTPHRPALRRDCMVSINAKPPERIALRETLTTFMEDAVNDRIDGEWLENYEAGRLRVQEPYMFTEASLKGWRIHCPNLAIGA